MDFNLKKYNKDLLECIKSYNLNKLNCFIKNHIDILGETFYLWWQKSNILIKELTLCNMVLAKQNYLQNELVQKAKKRKQEILNILDPNVN